MTRLNRLISVTFMSGPEDGKTVSFPQPGPAEELVLRIGRREDCELHLPYDNQVSRIHACLGCKLLPVSASESVDSPVLLSFWLEDSDSRNGTFINKKRVRGRIELRPGTLFRTGRTWLRLDVPLSYATIGTDDFDDSDEFS